MRHLLGIVFFVLFAGDAAACSCLTVGDSVNAVGDTDVVFRGTVIATSLVLVSRAGEVYDRSLSAETVGQPHRVAVFRVVELFKGDVAPYVLIATGGGGGDCGYPFETGKTYLVYASRTRDKRLERLAGSSPALTTSICSFTAPMEEKSQVLDRIRKSYPPTIPLFMQ